MTIWLINQALNNRIYLLRDALNRRRNMAKFLNTTGVSYHLEELIKGTKEKLILISPYLQFSPRIKEHITNLNIQKRDIRIVYRDNKLQFEENNWLVNQIGVRTSTLNVI